jgi:hypothetical protein
LVTWRCPILDPASQEDRVMTTRSDFTDREMELIGLLTQRFASRNLDAAVVSVHTQEGGERPTLRLTLDDTISTDFARSRIADASQSIEALAEEAASELVSPAARIGP